MEDPTAELKAVNVKELIALWERLAAPRNTLQRNELIPLQKLCGTIKKFGDGRTEHVVRRGRNRPILRVYMSDDTPIRTTERFVVILDTHGKPRTVRRGGRSNEFAVERAFTLVVTPENEILVSVELRDPVCLTEGKGALHHYALYRLFEKDKSPRELGHRGILVLISVFDRLLQAPLGRYLQAHSTIVNKKVAEDEDDLEWLETYLGRLGGWDS